MTPPALAILGVLIGVLVGSLVVIAGYLISEWWRYR